MTGYFYFHSCFLLQTLDNEQLFYTDWWKRIPKRSRNKSSRQLTDKLTTSPVKLFSDDEDEEPVTKKSKDQCEETRLDTKTESDPEANVKSLNRIASLFERIAILGNFESANSVGIALFIFLNGSKIMGFLFVT